MKCPKCNYENKDDAIYCGLCYEVLKRVEPINKILPNNKTVQNQYTWKNKLTYSIKAGKDIFWLIYIGVIVAWCVVSIFVAIAKPYGLKVSEGMVLGGGIAIVILPLSLLCTFFSMIVAYFKGNRDIISKTAPFDVKSFIRTTLELFCVVLGCLILFRSSVLPMYDWKIPLIIWFMCWILIRFAFAKLLHWRISHLWLAVAVIVAGLTNSQHKFSGQVAESMYNNPIQNAWVGLFFCRHGFKDWADIELKELSTDKNGYFEAKFYYPLLYPAKKVDFRIYIYKPGYRTSIIHFYYQNMKKLKDVDITNQTFYIKPVKNMEERKGEVGWFEWMFKIGVHPFASHWAHKRFFNYSRLKAILNEEKKIVGPIDLNEYD